MSRSSATVIRRSSAPTGSRPPIVDTANFLLATRDTGYRSTPQAIAEFIDNALQAEATRIDVTISQSRNRDLPLEVTITDDGHGMTSAELAKALTFGGSSRFDDRAFLGRYGMGLPNGALSRARRVEVYSWQGREVLWTRLDIDELSASRVRALPPIEVAPSLPFRPTTPSGTVVRLVRCDRLEYKRTGWLARRLEEELGRIYRRFLGAGVTMNVNSHSVTAIDPLFLQVGSRSTGATSFGDELTYKLEGRNGGGEVRVRFVELPIDQWHGLTSDEKRELGVTGAPTVSVLRADREIDRGWFFMGQKRHENYDDWWRCEVRFSPELDELFGITHSKQSIVPTEELLQALVPDLEGIARALNSRVRQRFELVKAAVPLGEAERQAGRAERSLPALPRRRSNVPAALAELVRVVEQGLGEHHAPYRIVATELPTTGAFEIVQRDPGLLILLNSRHPLYRDLYGPLAASDSGRDQEIAKQVALALLAVARAEVSTWQGRRQTEGTTFRQTWADVLATFLNA